MVFHEHFLKFLILLSFALSHCKANPLTGESQKQKRTELEETNSDSKPAAKIPRIQREDGSDATADTSISEEASIATDVTGAYLRFPTGLSERGSAHSISSVGPRTPDAWRRYRLTIPTRDADDPLLIVVYRIYRDQKVYYGLIPKTELQFEAGAVSFRVEGAGIYQAARAPVFSAKIPDVEIQENLTWILPSKKQITTLGPALDFDVLSGSLFVASDTRIEYLPFGSEQVNTVALTQGANIRRIAMSSLKPFVAQQLNGIGYFVNFTAPGGNYQGDFRPLPISSAGAFEVGAIKSNDPILVVLEDMTETGFSGRLSLWDTSGQGPIPQNPYPIQTKGKQTISTVSTNGSLRIGELAVTPSRIYAILRDGLRSFAFSSNRTITQDSVIEDGLDQPFCLAPSSQDTLLFVCHKNQKIAVLSTIDNTKPSQRAEVDIGEALLGAAVKDNLLFVLARSGRLYSYDIADVNRMVRLGVEDLGLSNGKPLRIKVIQGHLYISFERNVIFDYVL